MAKLSAEHLADISEEGGFGQLGGQVAAGEMSSSDWAGYLWRMHDNAPEHRPADCDLGVEVAEIILARRRARDDRGER